MRVTYFAADLSDAATARRVRILRRGDADVTLVGFRRSATPVETIEGVIAIDLGQTFSGRLGHRCAQMLQGSLKARQWKNIVAGSDVLLARNLEMATIASAARRWAGSQVPLAYECLDIHAAQLGRGAPSKLLRGWECHILRRSALLIVSSQAHVTHYFEKLAIALPEVVLAENKRVLPEETTQRPQRALDDRQPPWRIGWFGLLRCVESFHILLGVAQRHSEIDITLRGRPVPEFQSLIDQYLPLNNMRFCGPYTEADLAASYGACDFAWAVEYAGQNAQNAKWAMGNRVYEGGYYNNPVIALAKTAMGDWLKNHGVGVVLDDPHVDFAHFIQGLTTVNYRELQRSTANIPIRDLLWTTEDCRRFVGALENCKDST